MSAPVLRAYDRAAVVIPAHPEPAKLPACLRAVLTAALGLPIPVLTVVVLDAGDADSAALAGQYGPDVHFVRADAHHAAAARAVGFGYVRSLFADDRCWYATTDAGSRVDPGWLVRQVGLGADMVLGIHRADMGFSARAYWRVGGFRALSSGEDVDLVERFEAAGYTIHRHTESSVSTWARTRARAPHGFACYLRQLGASVAGDYA
jgi:glycosyltransferase involved in cell wall biosynthesis